MDSQKIKVYIVDIEENTISRLEELFYNNSHLGIKIIGYAYNYNNCINDFGRAKDADVFLISAYLPDTMGTELIGQIKKINPKAKIIVTLSKNTRNLAEVSREKGADDFIQKPFKARQLIEKVYEVTGRNLLEDSQDNENDEGEEQETFPFPSVTSSVASYDDQYELSAPFEDSVEPDEPFNEESDPSETSMGVSMEDEPQNNHQRRALFDVYSESSITSSIYQENDNDYDGEKPNVVAVVASPGSNGKTTMLVNAAVAIQKYSDYKPKICIVDFNLLFPSVQYKFHQDDLILCKKNIYDLFDDINSLTPELINSALVTHEPTGIKIMDTPSDVVRDLRRINPESIQQLIMYLREMFDLVLIDTSSNIRDDATSFPLTIADKGIILLEPDLATLLHTRKLVTLLKMFEKNLSEEIIPKLNFVLNKENPKAVIHVDTIKRTLYNADVRLTIPEDNTITRLANDGQFVVDTNSAASRSIKELARIIYPFDEEFISLKKRNEKKKSGLFSNLFKRK